MTDVLFLSGGENQFYEEQRNAYPEVNAEKIFSSNSVIGRILRRVVLAIDGRWLGFLYGDWKRRLFHYEFVILPVSIYSRHVAQYITKHSSAGVIHWYWNPVSTTVDPKDLYLPGCVTFSFDRVDCDQYGLRYSPTYYFKNIKMQQRMPLYDLCFVGADKGRLDGLLGLKAQLEGLDLRCLFHITGSDTKKVSRSYGYQPTIDYTTILDYISKSIAIVDFVQDGQSGLSQRPMEALFFERKLVTNDRGILSQEFYSPENVFVLGLDPLHLLPAFINRPYKPLDAMVREQYDFGVWVSRIVSEAKEELEASRS